MMVSVLELKRIINEELKLAVEDKNSCRGSAIHAYSTGQFVDKDKVKGSYSLSNVADDCDRRKTQATRQKGSASPGRDRKPCGRKDRRKKCRGVREQEVLLDPPSGRLEPPQSGYPVPTEPEPRRNALKSIIKGLEMHRSIVSKVGLNTTELAALMNILVDAVVDQVNTERSS